MLLATNGVASLTLPIPADSALNGFAFFTQALAFESSFPLALISPALASNALGVVVGL